MRQLYPGSPAQPLDLSLTNPNGRSVSITSLTVTLKSIALASRRSSQRPCTPSDFQVEQFSGSVPFTVGARRTVTLSALGFPESQLPHIVMVNQPYNQDGCEGARLSLSYSGTAAR